MSSDVTAPVALCLLDLGGGEDRLSMPGYDARVWHGFLPSVGPGRRHGYRVDGPYHPGTGHGCNPVELLLDPYARATEVVVLRAPR